MEIPGMLSKEPLDLKDVIGFKQIGFRDQRINKSVDTLVSPTLNFTFHVFPGFTSMLARRFGSRIFKIQSKLDILKNENPETLKPKNSIMTCFESMTSNNM